MKAIVNAGGIAHTNSFLIADEGARQAVLFDAPNDTTAPLIEEARSRGWEIVGLWLTHGHFDHLADHGVVTAGFPGAKVLMHAADEPALLRPSDYIPWPVPFTIPGRSADATLVDGQVLTIGSTKVNVIHTPGHSPGHVIYYFPADGVVIGGDMIIGGAIGRTDLPGSDEDQMMASLRRMMELPPETKLLPGHGEITTLAHERETNPYLRMALGL